MIYDILQIPSSIVNQKMYLHRRTFIDAGGFEDSMHVAMEYPRLEDVPLLEEKLRYILDKPFVEQMEEPSEETPDMLVVRRRYERYVMTRDNADEKLPSTKLLEEFYGPVTTSV